MKSVPTGKSYHEEIVRYPEVADFVGYLRLKNLSSGTIVEYMKALRGLFSAGSILRKSGQGSRGARGSRGISAQNGSGDPEVIPSGDEVEVSLTNIVVIGMGYVGTPCAALLADVPGFRVTERQR